VNPAYDGTKVAAHHQLNVEPRKATTARLRITDLGPPPNVGSGAHPVFSAIEVSRVTRLPGDELNSRASVWRIECKKSNEVSMANAELSEQAELSTMLGAYKAAVTEWIAAIQEEECLASVDPTEAQLDDWEQAHFKEEEARNKAKKAKKRYEDAIRQSMFGF
jgi:hypothetical protein